MTIILTYQIESRKIEDQLTVLCAQWVDGQSDIQWLKRADEAVQAMVTLIFIQVEGEGRVDQDVPSDLPRILVRFNEYLNARRTEAYDRGAPQKIEIGAIATQCGENEAPSECDRVLHGSISSWLSVLERFETFDDVDTVRREMLALPDDAPRMLSRVSAWERRLTRSLNRKTNGWHLQTVERSKQMQSMIENMHAQVELCKNR